LNVALSIFFGRHGLCIDQGNNPLQVVNSGELDDDLSLGLPQLDLYSSLEVVGEPISEILGLRRNDLRPMPLPCSPFPMITQGHQLLDGANGKALRDDSLGEPLLTAWVLDGEQGSGVPGA
jgi:hypothetical protein